MNAPLMFAVVRTKSLASTPVTGLMNVTAKLTLVFGAAGSGLARRIETTTGKGSQVTVLSVDDDAVLGLPTMSKAAPAGMLAVTVPSCVMPPTATL